MKRFTVCIAIAVALNFTAAPFLFSSGDGSLQASKKTIKENPNYSGKEVRWFKVLIEDEETKKTRVRITLPIKLIETFLSCAEDKHLKIDRDEWDIDLKELFKELKEAGPLVLIEVYEDGEIIKVWLE